jgi:DNA-directed RNA polymerase subunit omega
VADQAYIVTEKLRERFTNIYQLNIVAAARAHAIERGSTPRISKEECGEHKPTVIALKEMEAGLIDLDYYYNQKAIEQRWKAEREQAGEKEGVEKEDDSFFPRSSNEVI